MKILDFNQLMQTSDDLIKLNYWLGKFEIIDLYQLLNEGSVEKPFTLEKILLFLNHIKLYPVDRQKKIIFGRDSKTMRKYLTEIIERFLDILDKDKPEDRLKQVPLVINDTKIYSIIDITPIYPIQKPNPLDLGHLYYSEKLKIYGIKFEVFVNVSEGTINWVNPVFSCGGTTEKDMIECSCIKDFMLEENERILGDKGYVCDDTSNIFIYPDHNASNLEIVMNHYKNSCKSITENLFEKVNANLNILKVPYRGDIEEYGDIICIIFWIVNRLLKVRPTRPKQLQLGDQNFIIYDI